MDQESEQEAKGESRGLRGRCGETVLKPRRSRRRAAIAAAAADASHSMRPRPTATTPDAGKK